MTVDDLVWERLTNGIVTVIFEPAEVQVREEDIAALGSIRLLGITGGNPRSEPQGQYGLHLANGNQASFMVGVPGQLVQLPEQAKAMMGVQAPVGIFEAFRRIRSFCDSVGIRPIQIATTFHRD